MTIDGSARNIVLRARPAPSTWSCVIVRAATPSASGDAVRLHCRKTTCVALRKYHILIIILGSMIMKIYGQGRVFRREIDTQNTQALLKRYTTLDMRILF
ncbi:hypothetical protein EAG_11100 [Camponotus floridanus]|uniref:Uncharacterized protein n=1 Tax=Camponotus floridanus TaxID=104421 RepID=E1ZW68_CAMFO|nr:hypothetical protein EAG_11100 [Camponotus floridanus]